MIRTQGTKQNSEINLEQKKQTSLRTSCDRWKSLYIYRQRKGHLLHSSMFTILSNTGLQSLVIDLLMDSGLVVSHIWVSVLLILKMKTFARTSIHQWHPPRSLWTSIQLSDFIKNILIHVPKMNEGLTGLEQHGWVNTDRIPLKK